MATQEWPDDTTERERFALLWALEDYRQRYGITVPTSAYSYLAEGERWLLTDDERRGPVAVVVGASAHEQVDRLRKLGISLAEAMARIGYGAVTDSGNADAETEQWETEGGQ